MKRSIRRRDQYSRHVTPQSPQIRGRFPATDWYPEMQVEIVGFDIDNDGGEASAYDVLLADAATGEEVEPDTNLWLDVLDANGDALDYLVYDYLSRYPVPPAR